MKCQVTLREAGMRFRRKLTSRSEVKRSGQSRQSRIHAQKALMDYLLLGELE